LVLSPALWYSYQADERGNLRGGEHDLRTTLIASVLVIPFEAYIGHHELALTQIGSSVQLLESWTKKYRNPSVERVSSPTTSTLEDELVYAFDRFEVEAMIFNDKIPSNSTFQRKVIGPQPWKTCQSVLKLLNRLRPLGSSYNVEPGISFEWLGAMTRTQLDLTSTRTFSTESKQILPRKPAWRETNTARRSIDSTHP
jgi:hypothetical protein